jgi:hypothetical protein
MAVDLHLDYTERNDNKLITLTDISTGWSTPAGLDITTLDLYISITTSSNTTTDYEKINLMTLGSWITPATTQLELIYLIDASLLKVRGAAMGTADTLLPDGVYEFRYILNNGLGTVSMLDEFVLLEGNVRNSVYLALRSIPTLYMCKECKSKQIMDAIFAYGMLNSIRAGGYVAKTEELISQLYVLERLLEYGSSYTW